LLEREVYLELAGLGKGDAKDDEIIHRIMTDPKGWCLDAPASVHEGARFYDSIGKMFGPNFGTELFLYHRIRDNIQDIQKNLVISGVSQRNISIRDRLFSYPTVEDQLLTLESDRIILQKAVPEIIQFFVSLVQIAPAYNLFLVNKDKRNIYASVTTVESYAPKAVIADIYAESCNWEKSEHNCWRGKSTFRKDPDEVHLYLHLDHKENEIIYFKAVYPDLSRFPRFPEVA